MSDHQYKFNVTMTCGGCSGAVERVLKKLEGKRRVACFIAFDPNTLVFRRQDLRCQPRVPDGQCYHRAYSSYDDVLEKIKKTGKTVNSGEADGESKGV
jgi:Copper chaperone